MGVGTSLGGFFEDDHHYNSVLWDPKKYGGDEGMEVTPRGMQSNKDLDTAEADPSTGMGVEVGYKIKAAEDLGLKGSEITDKDIDNAISVGMSAGPGTIVGVNSNIASGVSKWWKGGEGKYRYEISDEGMKLADRDWKFGESGKLSEFIEHPELFKAYPEMKDITFKVADKDFPWIGGFDRTNNTLTINPSRIQSGDEGILDVAAHELQHWVQHKEGFKQGGNPDMALKDAVWKLGSKMQQTPEGPERDGMMQLMVDISKNAQKFGEYLYQRMPGEIEANSTMARRKLSDQQRKDFPVDEFNKFMEGSTNSMSGGKYYPEFNYPEYNHATHSEWRNNR